MIWFSNLANARGHHEAQEGGLKRSSGRSRGYQPWATRLPVLVVFASLLAVYIALIEVVIHRSTSFGSSQYAKSGSNVLAVRSIWWKTEGKPHNQFGMENGLTEAMSMTEAVRRKVSTAEMGGTTIESRTIPASAIEAKSAYYADGDALITASSSAKIRRMASGSDNAASTTSTGDDTMPSANPSTATPQTTPSLMPQTFLTLSSSLNNAGSSGSSPQTESSIAQSSLPASSSRKTTTTIVSTKTGGFLTLTSSPHPSLVRSDANSVPSATTTPTLTPTTSYPLYSTSSSAFLSLGPSMTSTTLPPFYSASYSAFLSLGSSMISTTLPPLYSSPSAAFLSLGSSAESNQAPSANHDGTQTSSSADNGVSAPAPVHTSGDETATLGNQAITATSSEAEAAFISSPSSGAATSHTEASTRPSSGTVTSQHTGTAIVGSITTTSPWSIKKVDDSDRVVDPPFTRLSYFAAVYLAPLLAIIAKVYWEIIYSSFKMTEPFKRLVQAGGSSGDHALFSDYLSNSVSLDAWRALLQGHAIPFVTLFMYAVVTVVSILAAESMRVQGIDNCLTDQGYVRCNPIWILETPILRAVEAFLIVGASFVLIAIVMLFTVKSSQLQMDPSSIYSIAALFNDESLRQAMTSVEPTANISVYRAAIQHPVQIGYHQDTDGDEVYGMSTSPTFEFANQIPTDKTPSRKKRRDKYSVAPIFADARSKWFISDRLSVHTQSNFLDFAHLFSILTLWALVVTFVADGTDDAFNDFFNSNTWRPTFLFALLAVMIDMQWKRLEREVRITEPWRRLAKGAASPKNTILVSLHGTCWSKLPSAILNLLRYEDMWFEALVRVVAVLSEFNIIAASTVPFNDGQTWTTMRVSAFGSVSITSLMLIVMVITMCWWRHIHVIKTIPRSPDTIGAVLSYLCESQMAMEFSRTHFATNKKQQKAMIASSGKRYRFGIKKNEYGTERWCLDFEDAWEPATGSKATSLTEFSFDLPGTVDHDVYNHHA